MKLLGILALAVMALVVAGGFVSAYGFRNEEAQTALEAGDYDEWKTARNARHVEMTSEDAFAQAQERYQERSQHREEREEHRALMDAAFETRDYEAWLEILEGMENAPRHEILSEDDFDTMADMHEARQAGDYASAEQLREELGLPEMGQGMHGGFGGQDELRGARGMHGGQGGMRGNGMGGEGKCMQ